jgi:hypothetical protein
LINSGIYVMNCLTLRLNFRIFAVRFYGHPFLTAANRIDLPPPNYEFHASASI